ncbi:MAG: hypothetical protein PHV78_01150 [Patescibacteria group bacterium]|nr:hypothetical protein [Patescibacteria group bacterium]MDD5121233.1 hypothetical protein [Patescibacteria group bacterium]MDD5222214.1 hypothetical protein [Patescibacteria group bacterium]MDD5395848.1 hypothetical protein [Patescibacteria group bacterium]
MEDEMKRLIFYWLIVLTIALLLGWLVSAMFIKKVPLLGQSPVAYQTTALVVIRLLKAFFGAIVTGFVILGACELVPPSRFKKKAIGLHT